MPTRHPLLEISEIDTHIEAYLKQIGEVTFQFPEHGFEMPILPSGRGQPTLVRQTRQHATNASDGSSKLCVSMPLSSTRHSLD